MAPFEREGTYRDCPTCGAMNPKPADGCFLCGARFDPILDVDATSPPSQRTGQDQESATGVNAQAVEVATGNPAPEVLPLEFHGSPREYFRIWIVNKCLTLVTLGIFSAWAKVRRKRYLYSHTTLGGTPFQYLGQPIPILKGRLIAAAGFLVYYMSSHFFTSLLPYVLAAGAIAAPWVIVRSMAFNARYSAFRDITFRFEGSYLDAFKAIYIWGIVPLFALVFVIASRSGNVKYAGIAVGVLAIFSLLFFPWWMKRLKKFIVEHSSFGGIKGVFSATGGQFYKIYLISVLIVFAVGVPSAVLATLLIGPKNWLLPFVLMVSIYGGYALAFAFAQSRSGNLVWNCTALGPIRFQSALRCRDLLKLYVTNALGIIVSLGLLIPWAVIRTMKYRADTMDVTMGGDLTEFEGSDLTRVGAAGAETVDFFDMDFSL